jgi:hypothetical protein
MTTNPVENGTLESGIVTTTESERCQKRICPSPEDGGPSWRMCEGAPKAPAPRPPGPFRIRPVRVQSYGALDLATLCTRMGTPKPGRGRLERGGTCSACPGTHFHRCSHEVFDWASRCPLLGTFETSAGVRYTVAFGGYANISQRLLDNRDQSSNLNFEAAGENR